MVGQGKQSCLRAFGALVASATLTALSPGSASAEVRPAGTGEPAFTNSAQNTQFFEWSAQPQGIDAYQVQYRYYANNAEVASPTVTYGTGPGSTWANWSGVQTLQHGGNYGICAQGRYSFDNDPMFFSDGPNSCSSGTMLGRRASTTIDRSKPTAALQLASGAAFVRDAKIPLSIAFADDVAGPFPATFLCLQTGGGPTGVCNTAGGATFNYTPACSVPAGAGKSTTFSCTADFGTPPDGAVWACAVAADAAIPDNPSNANQSGTADKANLSAPSCDDVVVDRTPPAVSVAAASDTVTVGAAVEFQANASDATSGLPEAPRWSWGDGSAETTGDSVTHSFAAPGTYEVTVTATDAAGNAGSAKRTITVTTPAGNEPPPPAGGAGGGGGASDPGPSPGPGPGTDTGGGIPTGSGTGAPTSPASLAVRAPRKAQTRARVLRVKLTGSAAGRVQLVLSRSGRVVARSGGAVLAARTKTWLLKLPAWLPAGRYKLAVTYRLASGLVISRSRTITLTSKRPARRSPAARASARGPVTVGPGPRALPDGTFHGPRPPSTFRVR